MPFHRILSYLTKKVTSPMHKTEKDHATVHQKKGSSFLDWIEKMGNKLPHPFWMFVWITIFIVFISFITSFLGVQATDPSTNEVVKAQNLLSGEGLRRFLQE